MAIAQAGRVAAPVDWLFGPDWLTLEQACFVLAWNAAFMQEIINEGGVDLNDGGLIEKRSLLEFQGTAALALHGGD